MMVALIKGGEMKWAIHVECGRIVAAGTEYYYNGDQLIMESRNKKYLFNSMREMGGNSISC